MKRLWNPDNMHAVLFLLCIGIAACALLTALGRWLPADTPAPAAPAVPVPAQALPVAVARSETIPAQQRQQFEELQQSLTILRNYFTQACRVTVMAILGAPSQATPTRAQQYEIDVCIETAMSTFLLNNGATLSPLR